MSPDPYWSKFAHVWSFSKDRPRVVGILEGRSQDGPRDDPYPVLMIRTDSGYHIKVNVTQKVLLAELIRLRPQIGDRIEIVFDGEAPKAPPGMNPVKEFTVFVPRQKSPPQTPNGPASGEVDETEKASAVGPKPKVKP